jgi:hypothetical protein
MSSLEDQINMIEILLTLTPDLNASNIKSYNYHLAKSKIRGLTYGLNLIFNQTCRDAAKKVDAPFIGRDPQGNLSCKCTSNALFNKPLRDISSLINIMNLTSYIEGEEVPDQYNLKKYFPELFSKGKAC